MHGFGIHTWPDGRAYWGHWCRGEEHGLGTNQKPDKQTKSGLWEDGKCIKWFEIDQRQKILEGELNYKKFF